MELHNVRRATEERLNNARKQIAVYDRLLKLGPPSLASLFVGGLILILVAINGLLRTRNPPSPANFTIALTMNDEANRFRFGYTWSVQAWLAIVGVGFGLLSFGSHEAYVHLFDYWCSRQAQGGSGLDYGRYLNTQPRAPVTYGFRGFSTFASLRYFLGFATIATSIGYKFGVVETSAGWAETLKPDVLTTKVRNETLPLNSEGEASCWFMKSSKCFTYEFQTTDDGGDQTADSFGADSSTWEGQIYGLGMPDYDKPPLKIFMTGELATHHYMTNRDAARGWITTREVILMANLTEEEGDFTMAKDEGDWFRIQTLGGNWTDVTDQRVVVDYRVVDFGKVQIQWAPLGSWLTDENSANQTQQVTKRITYSMHYTTAEVRRTFFDTSGVGSLLAQASLTVQGGKGEFPTVKKDNAFLGDVHNWIDAQVSDYQASVSGGINAILRVAMYGWAREDAWAANGPPAVYESDPLGGGWGVEDKPEDYHGEYLRLLPAGDYPFGDENDSLGQRARYFSDMTYPYFNGDRHRGVTGCYPAAAGVFLAIGILAWITGILRLWYGPAALTSWTGQHIYLSQVGVISGLEKQEDLASGYHVAPSQLGTLHLGYQRMEEEESSLDKD